MNKYFSRWGEKGKTKKAGGGEVKLFQGDGRLPPPKMTPVMVIVPHHGSLVKLKSTSSFSVYEGQLRLNSKVKIIFLG